LTPVTEVSSPIDPDVNTEAVLFVILIAAIIHPTIRPLVGSLAVHNVVFPLSDVNSAVVPDVDTFS
jgi:hypothetical protein